MNDFFRTRMGQKFYESSAPRIARALESIAESLEKMTNPTQVVSVSDPVIDEESIRHLLDAGGAKTGRTSSEGPNRVVDSFEFKHNDLPVCPHCKHEQDNSDGIFYEACGEDFLSYGTPNWTWNTYIIGEKG